MSDQLPPEIDAMRRDKPRLIAELQAAGMDVKADKRIRCNHAGAKSHDEYIRTDPSTGIHRFFCWQCATKGWDVLYLIARRTGQTRSEIISEARVNMMAPSTHNQTPPIDWRGIAIKAFKTLTAKDRAAFGESLGLSPSNLFLLGVGWIAAAELKALRTGADGHEGAYTFPIRDAEGNIIGIRLRFPDGSKKSITGSNGSGVFIPHGAPSIGLIMFVEGPTDTAATMDMMGGNVTVIGLPNNSAGHEFAIAYVHAHPGRDVVILHQNDVEGKAAEVTPAKAQELAKALSTIAPSVRVVRVPDPHKDIRDWKIAGATIDDIETVIEAADTISASARLRARYAAIDAGTFRPIAYPFHYLTRGTQPNTPGSITVIAGDPGSTKSFLVLQCLAFWLEHGVRADVLMLEKDQEFHIDRALAQRSGVSQLTDIEWKNQNAAERDYLAHEHRAFIDLMGRHIHTPGGRTRLSDIQAWIARMVKGGSRILIIDPITLADVGKDRWAEDSAFMREVGKIITTYGTSLTLTTHPPKKAQGPITLDHIAGGSAYGRAADTVLYLVRHDVPKVVTIKPPVFANGDPRGAFPMARTESIDREIIILKARESRGAGWRIGFDFSPDSLTFRECGPILREKKVTGHEQGDAQDIA